MGKETNIAWCHHTANFWWGCKKISPACAHCYAAQWDKFTGGDHWGDQPRRFIQSTRENCRKWNAEAAAAGERRRVFCMSMGDLFEDFTGPVVDARGRRLHAKGQMEFVVGDEYRAYAAVTLGLIRNWVVWPTIRECTALDWLLLTKRPENIGWMLPWDLIGAPHIWLGTTVESSKYLSRIDDLLRVDAPVHFVSCEPQLEGIDFTRHLSMAYGEWNNGAVGCRRAIDWIITGGESKQGAQHEPRPYDIEWARSIIRQCRRFGAAPFVKQLGSRPIRVDEFPHREHWPHERIPIELRHPKGEDPAEWPPDLRVQQFPLPKETAACTQP